jgi:hypothetical protein
MGYTCYICEGVYKPVTLSIVIGKQEFMTAVTKACCRTLFRG